MFYVLCAQQLLNKYVLNKCWKHIFTYLKKRIGVPVMAQCLTNPTRNHEVSGLIPGLAQWVGDLALP